MSFDTNGGSTVAPQEVQAGGYATRPEDPNKEGASFGGWYSDQELTTVFDFEGTQINSNITLYAGWIEADYVLELPSSLAINIYDWQSASENSAGTLGFMPFLPISEYTVVAEIHDDLVNSEDPEYSVTVAVKQDATIYSTTAVLNGESIIFEGDGLNMDINVDQIGDDVYWVQYSPASALEVETKPSDGLTEVVLADPVDGTDVSYIVSNMVGTTNVFLAQDLNPNAQYICTMTVAVVDDTATISFASGEESLVLSYADGVITVTSQDGFIDIVV